MMGDVVQLRPRQEFTANTAVFHALRVYGSASLTDLHRRLESIKHNTDDDPSVPKVPALNAKQVNDALSWLNKRDFVLFDRRVRAWRCKHGRDIPGHWRDTFRGAVKTAKEST